MFMQLPWPSPVAGGSTDFLWGDCLALLAGVAEGAANPEKLIEAFTRAIPLGRLGQANDLASAIAFPMPTAWLP